MSNEKLLELAARAEAAEGPDRELDWLIAEALGEVPEHEIREIGWNHTWYRKAVEYTLWRVPGADQYAGVETWRPKPRTASLDAAMTLVDDDTFFHVSRFSTDEGPDRGQAHVYPNRYVGDDYRGSAATPALALIAAALRARASTEREG